MIYLRRVLLGGSDRFRRNFAQLASTNMAAQLIGLAALPLLSRVFSPADFGSLAVFTSLYSIILSISALRLDWMIPRAKTLRAASRLAQVGLLGVAGISALCAVSIAVWTLLTHGGAPRFGLSWLPISILLGGAFLVLQASSVWNGAMLNVGLARLAQAISVVAGSLAVGVFWQRDRGLIIGYVCGLFAALLFVGVRGALFHKTSVIVAASSLTKVLRRRSAEMFSQVGLALVNIILTSSPILLLTTFFDDQDVGQYSIAFRVAVAPVGVITGAVAYSFVSEASNMLRDRKLDLEKFYRGTIARLTVVAAGAVVVAIFASFALPAILGGKQWGHAGAYLIAVTPYLFGVIVFSPTTHLFLYGKSQLQAILDGATLLLVASAFVLSKMLWDSPIVAIGLGSVALLCGYLARHRAHLMALSRLQDRRAHE